ncbi:small GTP-binding protein [Histomonas meleagridis]|uniref:small GTP-binding protein n=1 Tax=Histomonas meleagridis TaxID=135588 RepID=UPI00355A301F|nr:small GTP-binding protein [Histomonas meleagridis]KAH0806164.1 small GTP-binding protein [Histomonas meleagridis]
MAPVMFSSVFWRPFKTNTVFSMDEEETDSLKVVLVGDSGVGKTSIARRFVDGKFYANPLTTVGTDFFEKMVNAEDRNIKLAIWDTAGSENFKSLIPIYYKDANIIIFVFAVGSSGRTEAQRTFDSINEWHKQVFEKNNSATFCLCGNMCDLDHEISFERADEKAKALGMSYFETSALNGDGIENLFQKAAEEFINKEGTIRSVKKLQKKEDSKKSGCCKNFD